MCFLMETKKKTFKLKMNLASNLQQVSKDIPAHVKLVAVSKFHPESAIQELYNAGHRVFGESRMQELDRKQENLPQDIEWHFIGHLQSNKVKAIVPYVDTIHSVDSWKLLTEIDKHASVVDRKINCLLEMHIAEEDSKHGLSMDDCRKFLTEEDWRNLKFVNISGLMGMATNTDDTSIVRKEFKALKTFFDEIKEEFFQAEPYFSDISMGMSGDYKLAIEEGATIVRIGSSIFGNREI